MSKYVDGIRFVTEECCSCGIPFAMTEDFHRRRLADRKTFYCPSGHGQVYSGKSEEQKLKEQLARSRREADAAFDRAMNAENQRDAVVKSYTRIRERVKNGVCPCCDRHFQNLWQHMKNQHPEFGSGNALKAIREFYGMTQSQLAAEANISPSYVSLYEREKPIPANGKAAIDSWIAEHAGDPS